MILSEHEWIRSVNLVSSDRGNAISIYHLVRNELSGINGLIN